MMREMRKGSFSSFPPLSSSPDLGSVLEKNLKKRGQLPPEIEQGNIEYKLKLMNYTEERYARLVSQMKWRLGEGSNMCVYEIGVEDDGTLAGLSPEEMASSIQTLGRMAAEIGAKVQVIQQTVLDNGNIVCEVLVRKVPNARDFMELRIAVIGGTDAGKSTLLGVLTRGEMDNGRGKARLNLLSHRHEIESGKTSSICHEIIGFDSKGGIINYASSNISSWEEICEKASRVISFVDLAGSEKYLKTTILGLTGLSPNLVCLVVGAVAGVTSMTREHFEIARAMETSMYVVVTKIDGCSPSVLQKNLHDLISLIEASGRVPTLVINQDTLKSCIQNFSPSSSTVPIFLVSSVTGQNLSLLTSFLGKINNPHLRPTTPILDNFLHFQIEDVYTNVPDVGVVVGGTIISGKVSEGDLVYLGPNLDGAFTLVEIGSIHRQRTPVTSAEAGHHATIAFSPFSSSSIPFSPSSPFATSSSPLSSSFPPKFSSFSSLSSLSSSSPNLRRGMCLVMDREESLIPKGSLEFEASILVLQNSSELKVPFQGTVHIGSIRQNAYLSSIEGKEGKEEKEDKEEKEGKGERKEGKEAKNQGKEGKGISVGEQAVVRFRFTKYPEYIKTGAKLFIRDGNIKIVGHVLRVFDLD